MTSQTAPLPSDVLEGLIGSVTSHVVHVGGGDGSVLAGLLARLPQATGVLFDEAAVVEAAGPVLEAAGVADRVDVTPGEAADAVPPGGDVYLLIDALPDLVRCRAAMAATARLVVCDSDGSDVRAAVERAGFEVISSITADGLWQVVEARPEINR